MGGKKSRETRKEKQKKHAFISVRNNNISLRTAAKKCHMPTTTFHRQFHKQADSETVTKKPGRQPVLTVEEEETILRTIEKFANRGFPMSRDELSDCVELMCRTFSEDRRASLPFNDCRPGRKFLKAFEQRHKKHIKYGKASKQENKRFICTNAENLTTFYAELEATIRDHSIDQRRIANIDETGISPDKDDLGHSRKKHYGLRSAPIQQRTVDFIYHERITMLPVIFANGESRSRLFVFKASRLPYRTVDIFGQEVIETLSECLPQGSMIRLRSDKGGVNTKVFISWAREFVESIRDLPEGDRKVLLLYDAYRSHMSLESLTILEKGNVIAFAIPAHTSGTTQPLDVGAFQPLKVQVNNVIQSMCSATSHNVFDLFDLCKFMTTAYNCAFTGDSIQKGFMKTEISPFDPSKVLGIPRPHSNECPTVVVTPEEMEAMLEQKREDRREGAGGTPVVLKRCFLRTGAGLNLTSEQALNAIRKREQNERTKADAKYKKTVLNEAKLYLESNKRRVERLRFERGRANLHVKLYGEPFKMPRSLKLRRRNASEQAVMRKTERLGKEGLTFSELLRHPGYNPSQDQEIE